jgi:hypothetical protein
MRTKFQPWLNRFLIFITQGSLIFLTLFLLISELNENEPLIQGDISKVSGTEDTLQTFSNAVVLGPGKIRVAGVSPTMRYLAPRPTIDPMYALFFFLSALIIVFFFWDFSYKDPFTKKALLGLQIGFGLLLVFMVANFFRYDWFDEQVKLLTNGQFSYNKPVPIISPEFWILLFLIRLIRIFKKGVGLQKENDLTV